MPESIEVVISIRIPPAVREQQFYAMMQDWCERVGPGVTYRVDYLRFTETHPDALFDPTCGRALSRLTTLINLSNIVVCTAYMRLEGRAGVDCLNNDGWAGKTGLIVTRARD